MSYDIDFTIATSDQIEAAICKRLESIRLSRNITQKKLADDAGVSPRTIGRLEKGQGVSLDTFIRVIRALGIQNNFEVLLPDPAISPVERVMSSTENRRRASPAQSSTEQLKWSWGDSRTKNE